MGASDAAVGTGKPGGTDDAATSLKRRTFLQIIGASVAAGALSGCRPPREKIIPYAKQPPELTPGVANWYASTCPGCSAACGALVKVMDGRPIKLEGNPDHPLSRGGLCAIGQGAVAGLYDPYRRIGPSREGKPTTWAEADAAISDALSRSRASKRQVALITGSMSGSATAALVADFMAAFPQARHVIYDPFPYEAVREAHRRAYGVSVVPRYRFDQADLVVAFGADFLGTWLSPVEFTKQWSSKRAASHAARHIQVEARMSLTGTNADERHTLSPSEQADCLAATLMKVVTTLGAATPDLASVKASWTSEVQTVADRLADALVAQRGKRLVVTDSGDAAVQTLAVALNDALGNVGTTVDLERPSRQWQGSDTQLASLVGAMQRGDVEVLIIHGCNPAHSWPRGKEFADAVAKVPCSVATGSVADETTRLTKWHCPSPHALEAWSDAEPASGIHSIGQPVLRPLYRTRSLQDSLLAWSGKRMSFHQYLQEHWRTAVFPKAAKASGDFAAFWDEALERGWVQVEASPTRVGPFRKGVVPSALRQVAGRTKEPNGTEFELYHSVALRDGEAANNPWLQELPDPITKITWGNCACIAPSLATRLGISEGQWIEVGAADGSALAVPAHVQVGQHPGTVSIALGYGRTEAGPIGNGVGVNAGHLAALSGGMRRFHGQARSVAVASNRPAFPFAKTQIHDDLDGRPIVGEADRHAHGSPEEGHDHGHAGHEEERRKANLWGKPIPSDRRWGMVIDLDRCTGCSACVAACDIENNVPAVGPDEVRRSRDMHWMRIDRYFEGDADSPTVRHQPMMCQHCANASCESVCPVLATVHDDQGLNVQVYNRCVGTRYCANNCPYKVRRFNWFDNQAKLAARRLGLNPSVTVRSRGVMEKCSLCIQRIQEARIRSRNEGRDVQDGEVRTACEQSCPADAIVFGDLQDPNSRVARLAKDTRAFSALEELNRQPAIRYLARSKRTEVEA